MRKPFIAAILITALLLTGAGYSAHDIYSQKDEHTMEREVHYGDDSKAAGIEVSFPLQMGTNNFWDIKIKPGENLKSDSEYSHVKKMSDDYISKTRMLHVYRNNYIRGFQSTPLSTMENLFSTSTSTDGKYFTPSILVRGENEYIKAKKINQEKIDALVEKWEQMEEGDQLHEEYRTKDFMEYYEFGSDSYFDQYIPQFGYESVNPGNIEYNVEKLAEYFKIPVLDNEKFRINLYKMSEDEMMEQGYCNGTEMYSREAVLSDPDLDAFNFDTFTAFSGDYAYFTFNTHTIKDNIVDLSHIKDGYGIYRLPCNSKCNLDAEGLEKTADLDKNIKVMDIDADENGKQLYLTYTDKGKTWYDSIDIETGKILQTIKISDKEASGAVSYSDKTVNVIDLSFEPDSYGDNLKIAVLSKGEDGKLKKEFLCPKYDEKTSKYFNMGMGDFNNNNAYAFDGERLVICGTVHDEDSYAFSDERAMLRVYDKTGIVYTDIYRSSLGAGVPGEYISNEKLPFSAYPGFEIKFTEDRA